jgi:hypothetical protein
MRFPLPTGAEQELLHWTAITNRVTTAGKAPYDFLSLFYLLPFLQAIIFSPMPCYILRILWRKMPLQWVVAYC